MAQSITITTDDRVFVASGGIAGMTFENIAATDNQNLWVPEGAKHTILMGVNSFNFLPLFKTDPDFIKEGGFEGEGISKRYLMQIFVPRLIHILQVNGYIKKGEVEQLDCNLVIASKDKSYLLGYSGNIRKLPHLYATPNSNAFYLALYDEIKDLKNFTMDEKILLLFYYGWLTENNLFLPITIKDTKNIESRIYYLKDILKVVQRFEHKEEE